MTKEQTVEQYLEVLSSKQPVPGGGGASALAGALGSALGLMVGNLTVGKKKYAEVEGEVKEYMEQLEQLKTDFLRLAETEEQRAYKDAVMEENLLRASLVPLSVMEATLKTIAVLEELEQKGSVMAVSDVGVAVQCARTALAGAVMNVYINTKSMKDRDKADDFNEEAYHMLTSGMARADEIYEKVLKRLQN